MVAGGSLETGAESWKQGVTLMEMREIRGALDRGGDGR